MITNRESKISRIFNRLTDLPSLPKVVEDLLHLSDASASTREFANLIAADQGLSAKVLRLVNSAFYSLRSPVSSIRHASSLLGIRTLKSLALSVSVIQIFKRRLPGFDPIRFWRHALVVALAGRKTAERIQLQYQDEAYIAGLLHDIGIALLVQHFPEEFENVMVPGHEGFKENLSREEGEFGHAHPEVGFNMVQNWRLPELVRIGIRYHHMAPEALPGDLDPEAHRLIQVVQFADEYARRNQYAFSEFDEIDASSPSSAEASLGLGPEEINALSEDLSKSIHELESLYFERESTPERA